MIECPNCKMMIKSDSTSCIHCGAQFGNAFTQPMNNVQPMNNAQPMNYSMPINNSQTMGNTLQPNNMNTMASNQIPNNNFGVNNTFSSNNLPQTQPVYEEVSTYRSRILVTLPALGMILVYFYLIMNLTISIYAVIKLANAWGSVDISYFFKSKEFLEFIGADLLLIVGFIFTILHKKFMGFVSIVLAVILVVYDIAKLHTAVFPIILAFVLIICSIFYLSEEEPI